MTELVHLAAAAHRRNKELFTGLFRIRSLWSEPVRTTGILWLPNVSEQFPEAVKYNSEFINKAK